MITVWGRKTSSNVQCVMWCIAELGLEYNRLDIGHNFGGNTTADYLAMNPNGTVPVICDGDNAPLWESGAILRYLAGAYGDETFWPTDPATRAVVDQWAEWAKVTICAGFSVPIFWPLVRTAKADRNPEAVKKSGEALDSRLAIADAQLADRAYIAGDVFTLADIQLGHILFRYYDMLIERAPLPHLRSYYDRLTARTAYADHVMINYDVLRVE